MHEVTGSSPVTPTISTILFARGKAHGRKGDPMASGKVDVGGWLSEAWGLYTANVGLICVAGLLTGLLGFFTLGVLAGPLWAGLTLVILRASRKDQPAPLIGDVFKGFDVFLQALLLFVALVVAGLIVGRIPMVGRLASTLLYPLVMFAICLVADRKMEFWPAIMTSFEKAKTEYVSLLVVSLLGQVISAAGALLCGVGAILTAPFGAILSVVAYVHLFDEPAAEAAPVAEIAAPAEGNP